MILMKLRYILLFAVSSLFLFSCVSTKKFKEMQATMQARFDSLSAEYAKLQGDLKTCNDQTASLTSQKTWLTGTGRRIKQTSCFPQRQQYTGPETTGRYVCYFRCTG